MTRDEVQIKITSIMAAENPPKNLNDLRSLMTDFFKNNGSSDADIQSINNDLKSYFGTSLLS